MPSNLLELLRALPAAALVPAGWIVECLESEGGTSSAAGVRFGDLSVEAIAEQIDRAPSTVRAWCASGRLPGAYRLAGREWRIPPTALEELRQARPSTPSRPNGHPPDLRRWRRISQHQDDADPAGPGPRFAHAVARRAQNPETIRCAADACDGSCAQHVRRD